MDKKTSFCHLPENADLTTNNIYSLWVPLVKEMEANGVDFKTCRARNPAEW